MSMAVGLVELTVNLAASEPGLVGKNIAVAVLGIFHGGFFALVLILPFRAAAASRLAAQS